MAAGGSTTGALQPVPSPGAPRLLLVGDYPPPWGGIAVHVRALLELGLGCGFDARVLDVGQGRRRPRPPRVIPATGGLSFAARLAAAAGEGALVHAHVSGNNGKSWLVALAAGRVRRPGSRGAVLTVHSGLAPAYLEAGGSRRRLARAACGGYSRVLCVNEEIGRALARAGVPGGRIEVLPAAVPAAARGSGVGAAAAAGLVPAEGGGGGPRIRAAAPAAGGAGFGARGEGGEGAAAPRAGGPAFEGRRAAAPAPLAAREARRRHRPLLVAALAPGRQYGADVLLAAMSRIISDSPGAGLVVFGPGTGDPAWFAGTGGAGPAARIAALGELDHPAALATLALADVFVRPTRADGDSLSVREALALGVRVVASDVGHRPEEVVRFRSGDPADLAARVREALSLPPPAAAAADVSRRIVGIWRELSGRAPDRGERGER